MKYRRLGNSGTKVSEVALGGWTTFGESIQDQNLTKSIITAAYEAGINFFDIADVYARGKSEEMMGKVLENCSDEKVISSVRDKVKELCSHFPLWYN